MKKLLLFCPYFLFLYAHCLSFPRYGKEPNIPVRVLEQDANSITLQISVSQLRSKTISREGKDFQIVGAEGFGLLQEIGLPMLPYRMEHLICAPFSRAKLRILRAETRTIKNVLIFPGQEPRYALAGHKQVFSFRMDRHAYSQNRWYPKAPVQIKQSIDYRGVPLARIQITPVLHNPAAREIILYRNLVVKIEYESYFSADYRRGKKIPGFTGIPALNTGTRFFKNVMAKSGYPSQAMEAIIDVVIVTVPDFQEAAETMARWQRMKGYGVHVEARDNWTSSEVKNFVHDFYDDQDPAPKYLLIIGDQDDVPGEGRRYDGENYVTDLYYTTMGGNNDYYPEMARGRISPADAREAMVIVNKNINYEKNPPQLASFYRNALSCGFFQDYGEDGKRNYADRRFVQTVEEVKTYLNDFDINSERVYYADSDTKPLYWNDTWYSWGEPVPDELRRPNFAWDGGVEDIARGINDGVFLIYHYDHGYENGWADPEFTSSDIDLLHNQNVLPIIFSIDCLVGAFDYRQPCFAENITRLEDGGAVGIVAATGITYSGANEALLVGMIDAIWPGMVLRTPEVSDPDVTEHGAIYTMGDVMDQGLFRMTETSAQDHRAHHEMYHYFGDPTLRIWIRQPQTISVTHGEKIVQGAERFALTNVNMEEGTAVLLDEKPGTTIGKCEIHSGGGSITLPATLEQGAQLTLVLTGQNYTPYIRQLEVVSSASTLESKREPLSLEVRGSRVIVRTPWPHSLQATVLRASGEIIPQLSRTAGNGFIEINLEQAGLGVYFLDIRAGKEHFRRKVNVVW